jgi:DNA-binding CsgD family transcriptional regulator
MSGGGFNVTPRETEILSWVAAGKSDWAIGQILRISGKTVNFHVENAKRKLGVGTRVQAAVVAMRCGKLG